MGFDSWQEQKFYPASLRSFWPWGSPNLLPNGRRGAKLLEREADSSLLSSAEFENVGSLTFTLPMAFHAVVPGHRELYFYFYFCLVHVLQMSCLQCLLVGRLPEWRLAVRICFNGQFVCRRYDREISEISIAVESDPALSNVTYTCIQQAPWLLFINDVILFFDLIDDNDVCGCRRRRGSDVSQGQASNTKGRSCSLLNRISRTLLRCGTNNLHISWLNELNRTTAVAFSPNTLVYQ